MNLIITIEDYCAEDGIQVEWENNSKIYTRNDGDNIYIKANANGLRQLAKHFLTLAQDNVCDGVNIHYDDLFCGLEKGSVELIVERNEK